MENIFDLCSHTGKFSKAYSSSFRNVLTFKVIEVAERSVRLLEVLYRYFERIGDRAGQHHAKMIALPGMNRARWRGKKEQEGFLELDYREFRNEKVWSNRVWDGGLLQT